MQSLAFGAVLFAAAATSAYAEQVISQQTAPAPPEMSVAPAAPKTVPEPSPAGGGRPDNICQELVAFVEQREQTAAAQQTSPQQGAPNPPVQHGPPVVDAPQQRSGITAPVPPPDSAQKPPFVSLEQARASLKANDLTSCQQAAQQMRRAGVPMPDSLMALAALRPDLLKAAPDQR